jgi:hypothetical protein
MRTWLVALAAVSWLSSVAAADAGPPGMYAPPPPVVPAPATVAPAPEGPSALDEAAQYPASDRGAVFENAITVPQGQAELDARATIGVAMLDLRIGVTSTTELSAEVGGVFANDPPVPEVAIGIKQVLVRGRRFRLAIDGSLRTVVYQQDNIEPGGISSGAVGCCGAVSSGPSTSNASVQIGALGLVATGCVDGGCTFRLTAGAQVWGAFGDNSGGTVEVAWMDAEVGSPRCRLAVEAILGFGGGSAPAQVVTIGLRGGGALPYFGFTGRL